MENECTKKSRLRLSRCFFYQNRQNLSSLRRIWQWKGIIYQVYTPFLVLFVIWGRYVCFKAARKFNEIGIGPMHISFFLKRSTAKLAKSEFMERNLWREIDKIKITEACVKNFPILMRFFFYAQILNFCWVWFAGCSALNTARKGIFTLCGAVVSKIYHSRYRYDRFFHANYSTIFDRKAYQFGSAKLISYRKFIVHFLVQPFTKIFFSCVSA